jgi:hypothetical protein
MSAFEAGGKGTLSRVRGGGKEEQGPATGFLTAGDELK